MPLSYSSAYTLDGFLLLTRVKSNHLASVYKVFAIWANSRLRSHLPLLLPATATVHLYSFPKPTPTHGFATVTLSHPRVLLTFLCQNAPVFIFSPIQLLLETLPHFHTALQ